MMANYEVMTYRDGAEYTIELGSLIENGFKLTLDQYPIFDEAYREPLNNKILDHYWFREIGAETPALFNWCLRRKLNEIMPFYNQLYESAGLAINPLINVDVTTDGQRKGESDSTRTADHAEKASGNGATTSDSTSTSETLISETPQMQLSGRDDYATALNKVESGSNASGTSSESSTRNLTEKDASAIKTIDDYINHTYGLSGITQSQALQEYRATMLNIDMLIIEELAPLFMGVWNPYANVQ